MDSLLLSRLTKDFLNQDLELIPKRERYRMGWVGSILASHPQARPKKQKKRAAYLLELKERFALLFDSPIAVLPARSPSVQLSQPVALPPATFRPAWYFSKGGLEHDQKKNPEPIPYLLTETDETTRARPVPHNSFLLRSLCKGKGVLRQNKQGLVYLDIDNRFISLMIPYLKFQGLVRPPYFNLFGSPDGAHIPIIPAREVSFRYLDEIEQLGDEFSFEIEGLFSMEPLSWPEVEQVWFFKLHSEELEQVRRRHFLPALPGGHPFHIAVAVKPRTGETPVPNPFPLMRINTGLIPA